MLEVDIYLRIVAYYILYISVNHHCVVFYLCVNASRCVCLLRGQATADFTESESEAGFALRRRRRRNRSTETLTYADDGCWDGSQSTLARCPRHAARYFMFLAVSWRRVQIQD